LLRAILYILIYSLSVVVLAKARSRKVRQAVLLLASYALYVSWGAWFAAVLLGSTVMNFLVGEWLRRKPAKPVLALGILLNLALLSSFKYVPEMAVSIPFASLQKFAHLALPLGISFWTFQAMSYLFDLYREEELDPSFLEFALYMAFFPVAISGPICRMPEMLPQFRSQHLTAWSDIGRGFARIATGAFMMQLALLLGQGILSGDGINTGFDHATNWSGPDVWCLAFGYGLQLFFDFAGYSHIAIGAAKALGITVPENFARPFQSTTPSIFWTRWHMSLSFWIRDYVFLPLAMVRREIWWRNCALVVSMVLFGLWHKASLLFLLWGCYHGVLLVIHRQIQQMRRKAGWDAWPVLGNLLSWFATITLVSLGWILFRATSLAQAQRMFSSVVTPASYFAHVLSASLYWLVLALAAGYAAILWINDTLNHHAEKFEATGARSNSAIVAAVARYRWYWIPPLYAMALAVVLLVTHNEGDSAAQFMYRRF
jgi:D-alanyl-lipoteichoic acid acyltransferase DltB (MBOAT superfamily)